MIMAWLMAKGFLGLKKWMWLIVAFILAATIIITIDRVFSSALDNAEKAGAATEQANQANEVLKRTEKGNDVRNTIDTEASRTRGCNLYKQCVRANRQNKTACERFLPELQAGDSECEGDN